ncbi:hypothetical protein HNQ93_001561 [Hymenobacter luteus]|uniref:Right-handed parallel beta-helix repeat-containing protein n=2 Tax=Hymenobacter TaxID=89966 RepID=A0A7W9WBS1_9BACT|nr:MULTISPECIES: glycosyl hydrolase [Hymenobacter]MBB4601078.1 hypothetical protein [Hymenobacter latericoloratus]MBB6058715.1 hypothetical protein [Hymenobacter luteus]
MMGTSILRLAGALGLLLLGSFCRLVGQDAVLVITQGGTYSGRYESQDSDRACIRIATTEPVVLENCELRGPGRLIDATAGGARLTVRNCRGYGQPPTADNRTRGRFLEINKGVSLLAEHNYLEHTAGLLVYQWSGDGSATQTITVRYNQARNIDGRFRNGGGAHVSFLQLNEVHGVERIDIGWNQVINEPNNSLVEDNINLHNSSGTPASPLRVHDNYLQGAYPLPATAPKFTGSGITTDGDASSALTTTAYVEAYQNHVVSTCNAAMNIAAGHHNVFHHNRMVTSGLLPDGTRLRATYAATSIFNAYQKPGTVFFANRVENNTIGFVSWGRHLPGPDRHDLSEGNCAECTGTVHLAGPITLAQERQELTAWQARLRQTGQAVGPDNSRNPVSAAP